MKINHLFVQSFLGVDAVDVDTSRPVQLFCGNNGSGKSSLRDAIALALTADLGRVSLKKDAGQLVRHGGNSAICEVRDADGKTWAMTISSAGKIVDAMKGRETAPELPYVLDAQRFAQLGATERRAFLFGLMGVQLDGAAVAAKLAERGCDADKIKRIAPMLRAGFPAAADDAKAQATAAKGAWRTATGETYGPEKAAAWAAPRVVYLPGSLEQTREAMAIIDNRITEAAQSVGAAEVQRADLATKRQRITALLPMAQVVERRREKLQRDEEGLAAAQAALDAATAKAGTGPRVGLVHDLAKWLKHCATEWIVSGDFTDDLSGIDAALTEYEREHGAISNTDGDAAAREQLPALADARDLMASAVRNAMRDLRACEDAKAEAVRLQLEVDCAKALPDDAAAAALLADLRKQRQTIEAEAERLRALRFAADSAQAKTTQAAGFHADVAGWSLIAAALAPDGIPGEMLAAALGPINTRLAQSAADAQWPEVEIGSDMAITFGGRQYGLCSESEQWRADAMVAEAIAHISGARLLLLDRFDVLDLRGRADLIAWLDVLADAGEIDSAFLFGTLKAEPTGLPASIGTHWIESGLTAQPLKDAA